MIASASSNIYRISLDQGTHLNPFQSVAKSLQSLNYSQYLNLLFTGGEEGLVGIWDYRMRSKVWEGILSQNSEITAICTESQGMGFWTGDSSGVVKAWDLREVGKCKMSVEHQYRKQIKK